MNTTALICQWSMKAPDDLEGQSRSAADIRTVLLESNRYDSVARPALVEDAELPVLVKDPREPDWHLLADA